MAVPSEARSQDLFVVVGSNPLPNAVAIRLLLAPGGHVYFIYTSPVAQIMARICAYAGLTFGQNATKVLVSEGDGHAIAARVHQFAAGKREIGFNYTGGTKLMALHAYEGIARAAAEQHIDATLSYLDARTLQLVVQQGKRSGRTYAVGLDVSLEIEELLGLHGNTVKNCSDRPLLADLAGQLVQEHRLDLSAWYQEERSNKDLEAQREILLPGDSNLTPYWRGCHTVGELADSLGITMHEMGQWFGGHWLEHYTLAALQQIATVCGIHAAAMNVKTEERDFEFDVIALRGYQLYAFSCTTKTGKTDVKLKLFEAYVRARQMGGDEARVAVVCLAPNSGKSMPAQIQRDLEDSWDATGKIRVFGEQHLPQLARYLQQWIEHGASSR